MWAVGPACSDLDCWQMGIDLTRFAPGLTGLSGGTLPQDTPWDGSDGFVDPQTGTFYSTVDGYVVASDDGGQTFGTVYEPSLPGWGTPSFGTMTSAFGVLGVPFTAQPSPRPRRDVSGLNANAGPDRLPFRRRSGTRAPA